MRPVGIEPTAPILKVWCFLPLSYERINLVCLVFLVCFHINCFHFNFMLTLPGLNRSPTDYESVALPTELRVIVYPIQMHYQ